MKANDLITIATTVILTLGIGALARAPEDAAERARLEQAASDGRAWMEDTTAQLEAIREGVERITGDVVELAQRVDKLEQERGQ
ncbi:MAG: hypothetical protein ACRCXB_23030 [Aeromonadaceae bacterium]